MTRVLIVDPDEQELTNTAMQVAEWRFEVTAVGGTAAAQQAAEHGGIDLAIIADLLDQSISARYLLEMFWSRNPDLPVIVLVGVGNQFPTRDPRVHCIWRPFRKQLLRDAIGRAARSRTDPRTSVVVASNDQALEE